MAAIGRTLRRPSMDIDHVEAEALARSQLNAQKKKQAAANKDAVDLEGPAAASPFISQGVHTAFDDFRDVDNVSPIAPRNVPDAALSPSIKPSAPAVAPAKVPPISSVGSGWAPVAYKVPVERSDAYPVGSSLEQAVTVLSEQLREERKRTAAAEERAERLASELEKVRTQLVEQTLAFAK